MVEIFGQSLSDVKLAFDLFRESIKLFQSAKDLLPDSKEKEAASAAMHEAEIKAKIAEASLAKSLGFVLCPKCWPPVVLRATSVHRNVDMFLCPECNTNYLNHAKRSNNVKLEQFTPSKSEDPG